MKPFYIQHESVYAVPILHYTMEIAIDVKVAFDAIQPDCVAVELPETLQAHCLHAAARLPDLSVILADSLKVMCEPCDGSFEALRSALELGIGAYCIDLDVENYPLFQDRLPDPYAITHIGLKKYYESYLKYRTHSEKHDLDVKRELHMARRLKELSLQYEKVLFIGGFYHIESVLQKMALSEYPTLHHAQRENTKLVTMTDESARDVMAEYGWLSYAYELHREQGFPKRLDRQKLIYHLYKSASGQYKKKTGHAFLGYHLKNTMKFVRNYACIHARLMPDLFEVLTAAKGCVDHNYAYEVWLLATHYPYRKNIDNLEEHALSIQEVWGHSKWIKFHLKQKTRNKLPFQKRKADQSSIQYSPPSPFSICSYPPEDIVIEKYGEFLKKKGNLLLSEEHARTLPFTTSLEDGIDTRETIRHLFEQKLFVKQHGRPPGGAGAVVVIFQEESPDDYAKQLEKFPWKTVWHGEHNQESDMAFYATDLRHNVVGPGISRCEYGGFFMSYPPHRLYDIWNDPYYASCQTKAEVLLLAAIDYSLKPVIVYVSKKPPRSKLRSLANQFGKKIVYIPIGGLSPILLNKIRVFHVLDGHDKREIAGDYIF